MRPTRYVPGVRRWRSGHRPTDRGSSLIEIVIAVVLLGLTVTAMLTTLTVTISASATERDHANAHAWLQTATDVLYGEERIDCGTVTTSNQAAVLASYRAVVKGTSNPENWDPSLIDIVPPVLFWNGDIYQSTCYTEENINLQLVTIEVRNPNGEIVESVQVVKG